ncbi:unnamed protein product [Fraxinus pennsylvanica]|uniref:Tyrosinase copper-binding domain-containing protein n=1 Tax=Fraxinus pennsylvanica TaxID=56036 RepID=A0AAD2E0S8_9LAMI|nr:unnamed protein product [Fraxinus pennsylvanica]
MKGLPSDDPRSFMQQANVHCAYCNLTFEETGHENVKLQIHNCWLFLPWHRWYLYFYERIMGKLIGDPHFGLPYWNWDNPHGGMTMPAMFVDPCSSLFDDKRNQNHLPPKLVDLGYSPGANEIKPPAKVIRDNLCIVYTDLVRATTPECLYGKRYVAGDPPSPGAGSVDRGCRNAVHLWVGDPRQPTQEDMGNFYSTGREPLFFSHHANIDRLCVVVPRPKKSRSAQEKDEEEELLVIEGIEVDTGNSIKFDVFVNDIDNFDDFDKAEYASTFSQVRHKNSSNVKTSITLALNELLEVEDDDEILVSLPKVGGDGITIGGIKITYSSRAPEEISNVFARHEILKTLVQPGWQQPNPLRFEPALRSRFRQRLGWSPIALHRRRKEWHASSRSFKG